MLEDWQHQLAEAHQMVIGDIKQRWREISGGPSIIESFNAFVAAVDWKVQS